ncbi:MAG: FAD-binding protein, partial [Cytophagales bacterium]|nr:FAD-binding protein [Cytophagales bacterium]
MARSVELSLMPELALDNQRLDTLLRQRLGAAPEEHIRIEKRSIDARGQQVKVLVWASCWSPGEAPARSSFKNEYPSVVQRPTALIIGCGPAGLFAALRLVELGVKPIILERGKDVRSRRRDLAAIHKEHRVNPDSNYCFGEGGAGTYSDGKLYTRSKKRGEVQRILDILHAHGARDEILYDAHPHIGTNKLPGIITAMRQTLLDAGAEIHFETRVSKFIIEKNRLLGVKTAQGAEFRAAATLLATGHSARDIFEQMHRQGIAIAFKPFALGLRVEHPQALIDQLQYHCEARGPYLPAAAYSL